MSATSRATASATTPGASPRSTSCSPARVPAYAPGRRAPGIFTASASRTPSRSPSPITSRCEGSQVAYRPTVHYAYHPCAAAVMSIHELAGRNYVQQERQRILMDDIVSGIDELGVL